MSCPCSAARLSACRPLKRICFIWPTLFSRAGVSLFEAKRHFHPRVHPFPSGVDVAHFLQARTMAADYAEHQSIPGPRLGYAGVIDERIDLKLLDDVARKRPEWQLIMVGPTAKVADDTLPRRSNIHWLGMKGYDELPGYFAGWDVGIMPFALNDATRFISPTKTPEYLSAGLPVVSTPIRDVVRSYGELGLARIARDSDEFIAAAEQAMSQGMSLKWRQRADEYLRTLSWDSVWCRMNTLLTDVPDREAEIMQAQTVQTQTVQTQTMQTQTSTIPLAGREVPARV